MAWNIDGAAKVVTAHDRREFEPDPAYAPDAQVGAEAYANNPLDQGHIAAFSDVSWGDPSVAAQARKESCYFSNITPQLDSFNRSDMKGIWGQLENEIAKENKIDKQRISEFGGPILGDHDLDYRNVRVPREFWKLVVYVDAGALRAKGFRLTQRDLDGELGFLPLDQFRVYQQAIDEIGHDVGLDFGVVTQADTAPPPAADAVVRPSRLRRIDRLADVNVAGW